MDREVFFRVVCCVTFFYFLSWRFILVYSHRENIEKRNFKRTKLTLCELQDMLFVRRNSREHRSDLYRLLYSCVTGTNIRARTLMENLEKSWNFKMVISRPGKVLEKT